MEMHFSMMKFLLFLILVSVVSSTTGGDYKVINFTQKLDHFGYIPNISDITFQQKVFVNDTHWAGANSRAPIFVLLGGEAGDTYVGIMSLSGVKFRALLIHIQHRFYGDSIPLGSIDLAMENHQIRGCLSTQQALHDYATIIMSLKKNYSAHGSPVIVMGCGYAGALAAWFRLTYNEIVIGALASSTPLLYYGNYTSTGGFCETVSRVFEDVDPTCYQMARQSWDKIDEIASRPNGLKNLTRILNTCSPVQSAEEVKQWFAQMFVFAAKYIGPDNWLIRRICKHVGVEGDHVLDGMAYALHPTIYTERCLQGQYVSEFESPFEFPTDWTLAWEWQRCIELVFPVGCAGKTMLPARPFDRARFDESCRKSFGVTPHPHTPITFFQARNMEESLKSFGGNIIFSNGLRDPFSTGAMLNDVSKTIVAINSEQGSYCSDANFLGAEDPEWLKQQREKELKVLEGWISLYYNDTTTESNNPDQLNNNNNNTCKNNNNNTCKNNNNNNAPTSPVLIICISIILCILNM